MLCGHWFVCNQEKGNQMRFHKSFAFCSMFLFLAASARAQHPHGGHEHGKPVEFKMPTTYKDAVREILTRMHEIEELMASKKLEHVHPQADVIRMVGDVAGQLALKADSGVAREAIKEVNKAGRELAAMFDAIDKVADAGDAAGTRRVYGDMKKLVDILQRHAPKDYACPMRCEGERTFPKPGECSKCGMKLQDILSHMDHTAKYGGVFFMAPDKTHHLEGTISDKGEFRIYFYDEYTKPILADKFTAEGKARAKGSDQEVTLKMAIEPRKSFLVGNVDKSIKLPLSIKIFIDFKDGERPQVFDFDFDEPSKPPVTVEAEGRDVGAESQEKKQGQRG